MAARTAAAAGNVSHEEKRAKEAANWTRSNRFVIFTYSTIGPFSSPTFSPLLVTSTTPANRNRKHTKRNTHIRQPAIYQIFRAEFQLITNRWRCIRRSADDFLLLLLVGFPLCLRCCCCGCGCLRCPFRATRPSDVSRWLVAPTTAANAAADVSSKSDEETRSGSNNNDQGRRGGRKRRRSRSGGPVETHLWVLLLRRLLERRWGGK